MSRPGPGTAADGSDHGPSPKTGAETSTGEAGRTNASAWPGEPNGAAPHRTSPETPPPGEGAADRPPGDADSPGEPHEAASGKIGQAGPFAKRPSKRGSRRRRRRGAGSTNAPSHAAAQGSGAGHGANRNASRPGRPGDASAAAPIKGARQAAAPAAGPPREGSIGAPSTEVGKPGSGEAGRARAANAIAAPAPAAHRRPATAYGALDLGTNNCRLLVAVPTRPGAFRVIDAFSRIVRLGEGLSVTGRLSDAAMDRALGALSACRDKLTARPIERTRLIATEACRSAANGAAFLERVRAETGLDLEIVDRATEARLAVAGCGSLVDRAARATVLFDIGGGSSEIALIDLRNAHSRRLADHITAWTSLPVGVVTMAERFGGRHIDADLFATMTAHAEDMLADFAARERLPGAGDSSFHLIGTSGTVTTLAGIHLGLRRYDRRRVDGLWMDARQVDAVNAQLLSWSFDERVANPCIGRDRADLVLAGCAILQAIRNVWPAERLRVADRGLREGLLTEMMNADGVWRRTRYRRGRVNRSGGPS
ncbi:MULTISPECIES: hypothetical protein [unclassified Roseitalea]|uniref:Ppx/GppA phosphatase family protein n=1 Tax=unclassified Roseitalea TaxID=2639107 RepID=UPI00273F5EDB|nr:MULTISPECIES: hypothetical protein [unclassified Roseitalea]